MAKKRSTKSAAEPMFDSKPEVNLFRITQMIIGGVALLMAIFLLLAYQNLTPTVGLAFLFGIYALMAAMRGK